MNGRQDERGAIGDEGFDRALRAIHADAVSNVSARTRAQLRRRLRSATGTAPSRLHGLRRHGWQMASALVALVLVAGAYWRMTALPDKALPATIATTATATDNGGLVAVIDETPDLYLWLDSDEATRLASE
jgi:putative intracellular protease/amidase